MNKLKSKIIRTFIFHGIFLAIINAIINDTVDYFLDKYIQDFGAAYLFIMLLLNISLIILTFTIVARHFYTRIKGFVDDEIHNQLNREYFLYSSIAHDLKTPITVIKGYAQALMDDKIEKGKRQDIYRLIRDKADSSVLLLSDLLTYSNLLIEPSVNKIEVSNANLSSILTRLLADNYDMIEKQGILLELDIDEKTEYPILPTDFRRICENLLMNAIKHNPQGVSIQMGLKKQEKEILIYVADSGNKIDDKRIFEAFYTGDEARSMRTGHGLGLAIVSRLVEKYRGSIVMEESYLNYTKAFVVRLPLSDDSVKKTI